MFVLCCALFGLVAGAFAPRLADWSVRPAVRWPPAVPGSPAAAGSPGMVPAVPGSPAVPESPATPAIGTAVATGLVGWAVGPVPAVAAFLAVTVAGAPLVLADRRRLRLPDRLVLPAALLALLALAVAAGCEADPGRLARAAGAAAAVAAGYLALSLAPGAALGLGDVKLAGLLGLPLGWLGWQAALAGAVLPHLIAGPLAAALLASGRARRHTRIAFGPALLGGALAALLLWRLRRG